MMRRGLAVGIVTVLLLGGGIFARTQALESDRAEAVGELRALIARASEAAARTDDLTAAVSQAEVDTLDRAAVLAQRAAFVSEVTTLAAAIEGAKGKVDTTTQRETALAAQQSVLAEHRDPEVVATATATVHALTVSIGEGVAAWQAAQAAQSAGPGGPAWSESGPDGYARVRAALDRVGGGGVGLYESASCAGGSAPACANSSGYIKYRADVAGWSEGRLLWAMAHELGHIYQFQVWGAMNSSGAYQSLFGGDPEFLANCMALVRGYPGSVGCDGDQQAWASGIWVGAVR